MKKIVVTGGGTAGHLFPTIALGQCLQDLGYEVHLITDTRCQKYLTKDIKLISSIIESKIPSKGLLNKLGLLISLLRGTCKSLLLLMKIKPSIIIGFGGYPTFPPLMAAIFLQIPIIIYEQNCFMGKANRFFLRFANKVAVTYEQTKNYTSSSTKKKWIIGNIVSNNIRKLEVKENFDNDIFRILVFGGSQGAKIFSSLIPETIKILVESNPGIKLHITQQASLEDQRLLAKIYQKLNISYNVADFFHDMDKQYINHELVISRAGASTISELSYIGVPAIFIPLPSACENHQFYNAKTLEDCGAGWCFEQNKTSAQQLADKILVLVKNRDILKQVSCTLLKRKNDGGETLANMVKEMIG
jgi:UDP-N-acetylglucosamine--N-acetylmuramyl-(pentapeptide) pyrophosphoryl-undecaprenol N-acetylglucosamine transferase